ncbi:TatD DNase family protein [Fistulifera solaris]|uniref:TatD DNase family protein n=1 Tax=Fistulifera solaris TaxID=1519565 RepID=A0A1Z5JSW8_FISSO|nr:TatD DNase family protein [Fistulifera solaris]|eukprot:GAX17120.1 TatD DNase family protein [Fistulifera solaris]
MRWTTPSMAGFTYSLGHSLYIPLTSRCQSLTLPQTRGPGFRLPPSVVAALCRVRDVEAGTVRWDPWCRWLDMQDAPQRLPDPLERVSSLPDDRRPTAAELLEEITQSNIKQYAQIVLAGEGEPTLRMSVLQQVAKTLSQTHAPKIRVVTNGLSTGCDAQQLVDCGVTSLSVALLSSDQSQYEEWMQPLESNGHERVLSFVRCAVQVGLDVEITAVERDTLHRDRLQTLVTDLGVQRPVRWRPYFP